MKMCRDMMKKIFSWKPSPRILNIGTAVALLLLLIPLLRITLYSVPGYDDLNYGRFAKTAMLTTPGIRGAVKGAWECTRVQWYAWQGTFSSIFLMTLEPIIWGEQYYFIGPVFLIFILTISVFVLVGTLVRNVLHVDKTAALSLQIISTIMVLELIYTAQMGFYWYNGGLHYVGMHSFAMLFVAVLIQLFVQNNMRSLKGLLLVAASMLGALLVAGSNFVTALQGLIVLCSLMALALLVDRKKLLRYLPILALYIFCFYKNVSAPGNHVRAACYEGWGYSPIQSVWHSFLEAFSHLWEFTGWITLAFLVLLLPIIWHIVRKSSYSFRLPGFVLVWSFCLYATGFTPSLYSLGHAGLERTLNAVKITYQILLLINEVYWLGWLKGVLKRKNWSVFESMAPWWFYGLVGVAMLVIFYRSPNQAGCYSSYGAYYYVHTGEAYNFYHEYLRRVEILKSSEKDVVVEPYVFKPWFLCTWDLDSDPKSEGNVAVAAWYGKNSVVARSAEN